MAVGDIDWQRVRTVRRRASAALFALTVAAAALVLGDVRAVAAQSDNDAVAPVVTSLDITSTAPNSLDDDSSVYGVGDTIEVTATFDSDVEVLGLPFITLTIGAAGDNQREATYAGPGVSDDKVKFAYIVDHDDFDGDGISIASGSISLPNVVFGVPFDPQDPDVVYYRSEIRSLSGTDAVLSHGAVAASALHMVDGIQPVVTEIEFAKRGGQQDTDIVYRSGDTITIEVRFSEEVVLTGTPTQPAVYFMLGGQQRPATYENDGHDDDTVHRFEYIVAVGDKDRDGLSIEASHINLHGGTFEDSAGNHANLAHAAVEPQSDHVVHTVGGL